MPLFMLDAMCQHAFFGRERGRGKVACLQVLQPLACVAWEMQQIQLKLPCRLKPCLVNFGMHAIARGARCG